MIDLKMQYWLRIAWMILLSPIILTVAVQMFLIITIVNLSWEPAVEFWREWVF